MFPEIERLYGQTTPAAIADLEIRLGLTLPTLYKDFLQATNGGRPIAPMFPIHGMDLNPFGVIQVFFGIDAKFDSSDVVKSNDLYRGGIPAGVILIACTGGADYICLDLRNGGERVMFWDHRPYWGTGIWSESDFYFIAGSFAEFLASLRPSIY